MKFNFLILFSMVLAFFWSQNVAAFKECKYKHKEEISPGVWEQTFKDMAYYVVADNEFCPIPPQDESGIKHTFIDIVSSSQIVIEYSALTEGSAKCKIRRVETIFKETNVW